MKFFVRFSLFIYLFLIFYYSKISYETILRGDFSYRIYFLIFQIIKWVRYNSLSN